MRKYKLSLVIPCFNEEQNILPFYQACVAAFEHKIESYEMIFINDGSHDRTWEELKKLNARYSEVKILNFSRNFGKEAAMYAGLQKARGEYVSVIDADLQQDPCYVVEMLSFLDEHEEYDSVAMYQEQRNEGKVLSFFKKSFYRMINTVSDTNFYSGASDFRTFRHYVVDSILEMKEYFRFSKGIFSWVGFQTYYMPYVARDRQQGTTSWSFWKLMKYAIDGIVSFTTFPLRLSTYIGSFISVLSFIYMFAVIAQKLIWGISVPGYATIIVLILFIGGIQLIALGIIGTYLSRVYMEEKKRPIYIAKEYIDGDEESL